MHHQVLRAAGSEGAFYYAVIIIAINALKKDLPVAHFVIVSESVQHLEPSNYSVLGKAIDLKIT